MSNCNCEASDCNYCNQPEPEQLPDMSSAIASMGRGSMQRRMNKLDTALVVALTALEAVANDHTDGESPRMYTDKIMDRIAQILRG